MSITTSELREVPAPTRGSGAATCCGGHRERCLFGHMHSWSVWYEDGKLQRTALTFQCWNCGGVCTAEEDEATPAAGITWDEYIRRCSEADDVYRAEWKAAQGEPTLAEARDAAWAAERKRVAAWQAARAAMQPVQEGCRS